jgi:hypothetical protein
MAVCEGVGIGRGVGRGRVGDRFGPGV